MRSALFEKGWVDYVVVEATSRKRHNPAGLYDRGGKRDTVASTESADFTGFAFVSRRGTLVYPVEIELVAKDGTRTRKSWDGEGEIAKIGYEGASPLAFVVVDPDHKVLVEQDSTNNFLAADGARSGAPRVMERALYFGELALEAVLP
jgi:hypothetical protein